MKRRLQVWMGGPVGGHLPLHTLTVFVAINYLAIDRRLPLWRSDCAIPVSDYSSILSFIDGVLVSVHQGPRTSVPKGNKKRINFNISSSGLLVMSSCWIAVRIIRNAVWLLCQRQRLWQDTIEDTLTSRSNSKEKSAHGRVSNSLTHSLWQKKNEREKSISGRG